MRKQSKDFLQFFRRLLYCLKIATNELNLFWPYYWCCIYLKYVSLKYWCRN